MQDVFLKIYPQECIRVDRPQDIHLINLNHKFISGHLAYEHSKIMKRDHTIFITILRDPIDQLISHLNFILILPIESLPPLVLKIRKILDSSGIESFFEKLDQESLDFFINPQTKALLNKGDDYLKYLSNPAGAYQELQSNYQYIGITEAIPEFLERVFTGLGISADGIDLNFRSNVGPKLFWHKGMISNEWIEQLLSLDLAVYQMLIRDISVNKNMHITLENKIPPPLRRRHNNQ